MRDVIDRLYIKAFKLAIGMFIVLFFCGKTSSVYAEKYTPKGPLAVPRIAQTHANDCNICSLASVQAFMLGQYSYTPTKNSDPVNGRPEYMGVLLSRSYSVAGDYSQDDDPIWWKLYIGYGCNNAPSSYTNSSIYPSPMAALTGGVSLSKAMETAYAQLSRGVPVHIYTGTHASVIIGYRGSSDTLKAEDFTVMEIKPVGNGWKNSTSLFGTYAANPSTYYSSSVSHCYVTLSAWLNGNGGSISVISYPTGSPSESFVYDVIGSRKLTFTVKENGSNALAEYSKPYGASTVMKSLTVGTRVTTAQAGTNSYGNVWYKLTDGYYIWDGILDYTEDSSEVTSSEVVDLTLIVKEHETQPMYENRVPFGFWIKPVEHQAGDVVHAVKKLINSAGSTWYLLDSGKYMWAGVLDEVGANIEYSLTTEVYNNTGGTVSASGSVFRKGQIVTLTATPATGYKLNHWYSDNGGTFGDQYSLNTTFTMPAGDTKITATFVPIDYAITASFTGSGSLSAPVSGQYGQTVEITAEAGDGYYFGGWASTDIDIADEDKMKPTYRFTMPAHDVNIRAFFLSESTDLSEWQVGVEIPPYYSPDELEIQYKHQYTAVSTTSPGDGWARGSVNRTYYQNSGKVEEFPYEKATSNTYVYVGGYYYHWCGSNSDCNYQKTAGKYETYHGPNSLDNFDVVSSGADTNNSNVKWYRLQWKAGMMYSGLAWCATNQTANWYRMYQYQPKVLVTEYNWSKETDWVDTLDPAATSYTIRWRVIKPAEVTEIIVPEGLFSVMVGEQKKPEITTVPENADQSGFVYELLNPEIAYLDEELNIHALDTGMTQLLISAPNGVTASMPIHIFNNISSWELYINGLPTNREGTIDVYRVGQTVPYRVEYQLQNDVDPGYDLILYHEYEYPCIQDKENKTLTFIKGTVITPNEGHSMEFDLADFNFGYGTILVTDDAESVYLPGDLSVIGEEAFRDSGATYYFLPDGVTEIGDNAFPAGAHVFLKTQSLNSYDFLCDHVIFIENGETCNEAFAQNHANYFTRRIVGE